MRAQNGFGFIIDLDTHDLLGGEGPPGALEA
jgi:hypothetical protein